MKKFLYILLLACSLLLPIGSRAQSIGNTQHKVTASWQAPNPVGGSGTIAGYNLYRLLVPQTVYTKLNSALITVLNYVDTTVQNGQAYDYEATTVDSASNESAPTSPVLVTIPPNPNPPLSFQLAIAVVSVSITSNGDGTETVLARWTDSPQLGEMFHFTDGGQNLLGQGYIAASAATSFAETVTVPTSTPQVWFVVCNTPTGCVSQKGM